VAGVRNKPLAVGLLATAGSPTIYTCPAGHNTIVKSIYVTRQAGTVGSFKIEALRAGGAVVSIYESQSVQELAVNTAQLWIVLAPGDLLTATLTTPTIYYWVSGAELPLAG